MKRFTCINDREEIVDGAIEGTKEQVLAWMKKTFPGLRERGESEMMSAMEFFHKGDITAYKTADGESVYLAESGERTGNNENSEKDNPIVVA